MNNLSLKNKVKWYGEMRARCGYFSCLLFSFNFIWKLGNKGISPESAGFGQWSPWTLPGRSQQAAQPPRSLPQQAHASPTPETLLSSGAPKPLSRSPVRSVQRWSEHESSDGFKDDTGYGWIGVIEPRVRLPLDLQYCVEVGGISSPKCMPPHS